MTKVLLAVPENYIDGNALHIGGQSFIDAKADAQKMIEEARREVARECLDVICGYCNGEGYTVEAGEEGQAIQLQCIYCQATGINYHKINMLKQNYLGDEIK